MHDKTSPEVLAHLRSENRYTERVMEPTLALQTEIFSEMKGRVTTNDQSVPIQQGPYLYYARQGRGTSIPSTVGLWEKRARKRSS